MWQVKISGPSCLFQKHPSDCLTAKSHNAYALRSWRNRLCFGMYFLQSWFSDFLHFDSWAQTLGFTSVWWRWGWALFNVPMSQGIPYSQGLIISGFVLQVCVHPFSITWLLTHRDIGSSIFPNGFIYLLVTKAANIPMWVQILGRDFSPWMSWCLNPAWRLHGLCR